MKKYLVRITMPDGSFGEHHALCANGFDAVITAMENFPDAKRISARRIDA